MLIRFFPPLVAGTVIMVIGLSLIGADVSLIAGDDPAAKEPWLKAAAPAALSQAPPPG
jgi:xanthine/uracil permease